MSSRGAKMSWPPSRSRLRSSCVKLYLCSNPADSTMERKALRESVFPILREHCRRTVGVHVRVIDPYESSDSRDWPDEDARKQLIEDCRENSAGPFLLALLGHDYGSRSLPARVEVTDYQMLLQESQRAGINTQELETAYQRDENAIPPSYCLTAHRHTGCCQQAEGKEDQKNQEDLTKLFQTAASLCVHNGCLTPQKAQSYIRSALDADLRFALENCAPDDITGRCLIYIHKVLNAKGQMKKKQTSADVHTQSEPASSDQTPVWTTPTEEELLSELCNSFLRGLITSSKLLVYSFTTECNHRYGYTTARRRGYAESLCQQVRADLVGLIDVLGSSENGGGSHLGDALAQEQAEWEELCAILSRFYDITQPEEKEIRAYVEQNDHQCPLVVTGGPCSGKTVLMAHCAQQIKSWLKDHSDPVVISYFSSMSNHLSPKYLLSSLCYQIARSYHGYPSCTHNTSNPRDSNFTPTANLTDAQCPDLETIIKPDISHPEVVKHLSSLLSLLPSSKQPLVLILDGVDQTGKQFAAQIIDSLPSPLPPGVKLILTVSSRQTSVMQAIERRYPQCNAPPCASEVSRSGLVRVPLGLTDRKQCARMLTSLLATSGRRVTSGQQALVNEALTSCPLMLYARLLHVHTSLWRSDSDVSEQSLPDAVHSSISLLLDHLEQKHSSCLVARAVSYLTLSRAGLTEAELTDLLRGDNPSLDLRVTQVDVERLILDLKGFLVKRTVAGWQVLSWVSRHFGLVVARRYFSTHEARQEIHSAMADHFSGGLNGSAQTKEHLERQPLDFIAPSKEVVILRDVKELVHHLQESDRWELKHGLLKSLGFHQAMVRAGLLEDLVAMLKTEKGSSTFALSRERLLLASILKSSACYLQSSPLELSTVMETSLLPYLEVFPTLRCYVGKIRRGREGRGCGLGVGLPPAPSTVTPIQCLQCDAKTSDVSVTEAAGTECGIIAQVTDDGSVWIWKDAGCGIVKLSSERTEVKFAGVRSSGRYMLLPTQCHKLFLWDVTGPEVFLEVEAHFERSSRHMPKKIEGFVACRTMMCVWWTGESYVSVFDVSGENLAHLQCQSCVTCVVCSSDGSLVYCGQEQGTVSIFDTDTKSLLSTFSNSNHSAVVSILLCEDNQEIACVDRSGNVTTWHATASTQSPRIVTVGFAGGACDNILNTDYSEKVNTLLVCQHNLVTLWDTCDWEMCDQYLAPQGMAFTQAVLSQDGHLFLALLDTCPLVLVWNVSTGVCVLSLDTNKQPLKLLKRVSDIICVTHDGCLLTWDSEMIYAAGTAPKMECGVKEVVVDQMGQWFYTSDGSDAVWRWSLETGLPHFNFLHDHPVEKVRLSPDNIQLVTLSAGEIYVWQVETGQNTLRVSGSKATDILITPNSNFGVSLSNRGLSRVWKLAHGGVVCSIRQRLSDAQVSPESTFLIGCHRGDLLAASLWSGAISKRFPVVESVVAFRALSEHADFVVVMVSSGEVYTWNVPEETVCRHLQLPESFHCQPQDFQMCANGSYALLSTDDDVITLLDLAEIRLCSFKAEGPLMRVCLDHTGCYVAYIWRPTTVRSSCGCDQHARPVLTVVRLSDGERVGSVFLSKQPLTLVVREQQCVFVGFEDGSVGVYSISDDMMSGDWSVRRRESLSSQMSECPFDKSPCQWLPLSSPNMTWL